MIRPPIGVALVLSTLFGATAVVAQGPGRIDLVPIGRYETGLIDESAAEISAYDPASQRLFLISAAANTVQILDISRPWDPTPLPSIDLSAFGGGPNSVAVHGGVVAVAVEAENKQAPGRVVFLDTDGQVLSSVEAGALPDMVTFTPDGNTVLVANEGEPKDYCVAGLDQDPEGSISLIDIRGGAGRVTQADVTTAGFGAFAAGVAPGVRVFGPNATIPQDLEPEFIATDGTTAWVTLQENNALAVVDIAGGTVTDVVPLGTKDHSTFRNSFDASNRDNAIRVRPWPTKGMFQPDAIATYRYRGETFLVTANEGDARDYDCFSEEARVADLTLDPTVFPDAANLQDDANLGRLKTTTAEGDADADGRYEAIYSYGARSFSIWSADGTLVYDSGNELETITASALPDDFNANQGSGEFDGRSDDKGPEPEGVVVGRFRGRHYAFLGLERVGGVAVYDVTEPHAPYFVRYVNTQDFDGMPDAGTAGDVGPEGLLYIPKSESPNDRALLVVSYEVSGTVVIFWVRPKG